jgi:hypothetical protein
MLHQMQYLCASCLPTLKQAAHLQMAPFHVPHQARWAWCTAAAWPDTRCHAGHRSRPSISAAAITNLGAYELRNTYACCACCEAKFHLGCMTPETQRAVLSREPYFCSADCASVSKQLAEVCGRGMMKVRHSLRPTYRCADPD